MGLFEGLSNLRNAFANVGNTAPNPDAASTQPPVDQPPKGASGRAHFNGFIQWDEFNPEWIGTNGLERADRMWRTDADIKRDTLATWSPITSASWSIEPFGGDQATDKDRYAAELCRHALWNFMSPNIMTHLAEVGPILIRSGFVDFEQIWKSTTYKGKKVILPKKLDLRLPRTIWKYYQDDDGDLTGIVQFLPNAANVFISATELLHYRLQAEGDNWVGTALTHDTPIPTPDGWRTMGDLQVGDKVFDEHGHIVYVTQTAEWEDRPCFEVQFGDGTSIIADENHKWLTHTACERYFKRNGSVRTTRELAETVEYVPTHTANHAIPLAGLLDYPTQSLPVDPWVLGLWLGDGTANNGDVTCHADDVEETAARIQEAGYPAKWEHNGGLGRLIRTSGEGPDGLATKLRLLGLKKNKHVPDGYLRGSIDQRLELLRGLMDSDGIIGPGGQCEFANTNRNLIDGVAELVRSLGMRAKVRNRKTYVNRLPAWSVNFTPPPETCPFTLSRKVARCEHKIATARRWHYIQAIEQVENCATKCITTSGASHLYLAGPSMVPTHNSMYRHAWKHFYFKEKLELIDAIGQERKAVGVPVVYPPTGASDETKEDIETILANLHTNEVGFILMPGPKAGPDVDPSIGWEIQIITFDSSSSNGIRESIDQQTLKVAGAFIADFLELGHHEVGARATADVQEDPFMTAIKALSELIVGPLNQLCARIATLNVPGIEGTPTLKMSLHDEASLSEISTYAQQLYMSECLTPDAELEDYFRARADFPVADPKIRQETLKAKEAGRQNAIKGAETAPVQEETGETKFNQPGKGSKIKPGSSTLTDPDRGNSPGKQPDASNTNNGPAKPSPRSLQLEAAAGEPGSVMVALYPSVEAARNLAVDGGLTPSELHVTLGCLGKAADLMDPEKLRTVVAGWAAATPPLRGTTGGIGVFAPSLTSDDKPVTYASVDVPHLTHQREHLVHTLKHAGFDVTADHGYVPHLTLAYSNLGTTNLPVQPLVFDHVTVVIGEKREQFPLAGDPTITLDAATPTAKWWEELLSQGRLKEALDGARTAMETATRPAAVKLAATMAARGRSGRKIATAVPPDDLQKALEEEMQRLYMIGYETVVDELAQQHSAKGQKPIMTLDDSTPEPEDTNEEEGPTVPVPVKRNRKIKRRAQIAAEHVNNEVAREAERTALAGERSPLALQRKTELAATRAIHKEALTNAPVSINDGRRDAAIVAAGLLAKAAVSEPEAPAASGRTTAVPQQELRGIYTSVLDARSCDPCIAADDGVERELGDPALETPNPDCNGGDYCRCTVTWVLAGSGES